MVMGLQSKHQASKALKELQWVWDKSKTQANTEERSLQEALVDVLNVFKQSLAGRIDGTEWCRAAIDFKKRTHCLAYMVDTMDIGVDLSDFPRVMYKATLIP